MVSTASELRIVRHDSALSRWESVFRSPPPHLRPYVLGGYQGWVESATTFPSRLESPFPGVVLILDFGSGFRLADPRTGRTEDLGSFVAGLADGYVFVGSRGASRCIQVNFTPLGAYQLLGLPMERIANRTLPLSDLLGLAARSLEERVAEAGSWEERFAHLDALFTARLEAHRGPAPALAWAWGQIAAAGGALEVGSLAREIGWSRKHLIARFREQIGLPPKAVARIVRFDRVVGRLRAEAAAPWTEIALDGGFYDQAHLIRDFQEFAGTTPTEYLRRLLPDGGGVRGEELGR